MSTSEKHGHGNRRRSNGPRGQSATERLGEQAQAVTDNMKAMGGIARDAAGEQFDRIRGTAADYYEQGKDRLEEYEQSFEDSIRAHPFKSILIAAAIGYLFGRL